MTSDGDDNDVYLGYLKSVSALVELAGRSLDDALLIVPDQYRDRVRADIAERLEREDREVRFYRSGSMIEGSGPRPWFKGWNSGDGYLWRRLREYLLIDKDWALADVDSLDDSSDAVLKYLEEPRATGEFAVNEFRVQGLVLGYVQSGKTANFTSLIAKAVDRGYKLVIVLSGIHNSLRQQTQQRLDRELGLVNDPEGRGIGIPPESDQRWWPLTTSDLDGDFKPGSANAAPIQQGTRSIMVVKKNATVLSRLVRWLDGNVPDDLPVLVIDDEADQASINTNATLDEVDLTLADRGDFGDDEELDPSRINGLIRDLLMKFTKVSFVAYTATPFANVLIDPDTDSNAWGQDLFPRDFIYSLPRPPAYVGAERIFGRAAVDLDGEPVDGLDVVRIVPKGELQDLCPGRGDLDDGWEAVITPSLRLATLDWILATAAKDQRLGPGVSSMLVHVSTRVAVQDAYADELREHLHWLRRAWRYDKDALRAQLYERWTRSFRPTIVANDASQDRTFEQIEPHINEVLLGLGDRTVRLLNSGRHGDDLDYDEDPAMKVILVGGNRLSRGLTIVDLTVSFYVRESVNYDTLLQMGRWFGYRADFIDVSRLWTTSELVARFEHLALVEEELRDDIAVYERERLTPMQVAPKVRTHPVMTVTAGNKMGSGRPFFQSYAGERIQTTRFRLGDDDWLNDNVNAARELLSSLGPPELSVRGDSSRPTWTDVPWTYVVGFLEHFRSIQAAQSFDADTAARYIRRQASEFQELQTWTVSVRSAQTVNEALKAWDLGIHGWGDVAAIERSRKATDLESIGALVNPPSLANPESGDETVDLTSEQLATAVADPHPKLGNALRAQRDPNHGLLLVYPISPYSKKREGSTERLDLFDEPHGRPLVVGVALSFPTSDSPASVEYVIGKPSVRYSDDDE
jgi:hypothetical protein